MGNILDELKNVIGIECDECNGAGFIFFGNDNNFDVETCSCIPADEDPMEYILGM